MIQLDIYVSQRTEDKLMHWSLAGGGVGLYPFRGVDLGSPLWGGEESQWEEGSSRGRCPGKGPMAGPAPSVPGTAAKQRPECDGKRAARDEPKGQTLLSPVGY